MEKWNTPKTAKIYELPKTRPTPTEKIVNKVTLPAGWLYDLLVAGRGMVDEAIAKLQMQDGSAPANNTRHQPVDSKSAWPPQTQQELSDLGFNEEEITRLSPGRMTGPKKLVEKVTVPHHD